MREQPVVYRPNQCARLCINDVAISSNYGIIGWLGLDKSSENMDNLQPQPQRSTRHWNFYCSLH